MTTNDELAEQIERLVRDHIAAIPPLVAATGGGALEFDDLGPSATSRSSKTTRSDRRPCSTGR
jgi:hypothetical protein